MSERAISVVICTDGRLETLRATLKGIEGLDYRAFELVLVCGPTADGTREFVAALGVKAAHCPERNLGKARNLGIALAAGEIVAFLDDDAVPEPEWLADLNRAYDEEDVVAAGGVVYDATGLDYQARYVTVDRLGHAQGHWTGPATALNFPYSREFPHLLGANCSFRRRALIELGGFDEEYDYFLDETDLVARVNDCGGRIAQLAGAAVHHRPAPSGARSAGGLAGLWRSRFKNRVYFILRNGAWHHDFGDALQAAGEDFAQWREGLRRDIAHGRRSADDLARLEREAREGLAAALAAAGQPRRLMREAAAPPPFRPFPLPARPEKRLTLALISQDYPPGHNGGIARNTQELARAFAALGHKSHVFTRAKGAASLDFEDGVWVHRLSVADAGPPPDLTGEPIPQDLWDGSRAMFAGVAGLPAVDLVYAPLWDGEAAAFVAEPRFALLVALQTTLAVWLDQHPERRDAMRGRLALDLWLLRNAPRLHANSRASLADTAQRYGIAFAPERIVLAPHGIADTAAPSPTGGQRFLFVGRLEARKGIAPLLAAAPAVLRRWPQARLDVVGDDAIAGPDGRTYREAFLAREDIADVADRIGFHGRVDEAMLAAHYRDCDVIVAPSLYESFGLVFVEAMRAGKPVIAARAGGTVEVVADGETGLLVEPGDAAALAAAMDRLAADPELRQTLGAAGRRRFEALFTSQAAARALLEGALTPPCAP